MSVGFPDCYWTLHSLDASVPFPTDDANCCYLDCLTSGASAGDVNLQKNGVPTTVCRPPLRLSQQKDGEKEEGSLRSWNYIPFPHGESFCFIVKFLLDYREDNLVIFVIKSLFPHQGLILPY